MKLNVGTLVAMAFVLLPGCMNPEEKLIPSNIWMWGVELSPIISRLPPEEAQLLLGYAIRKKQAFIQDVTRVHVEKGTTVAHAIMEQRQWELKQEAAALVDFGQVQ